MSAYLGYTELVNTIIQTSEYLNWNLGLRGACRGGNSNLVNLMINKGAK